MGTSVNRPYSNQPNSENIGFFVEFQKVGKEANVIYKSRANEKDTSDQAQRINLCVVRLHSTSFHRGEMHKISVQTEGKKNKIYKLNDEDFNKVISLATETFQRDIQRGLYT